MKVNKRCFPRNTLCCGFFSFSNQKKFLPEFQFIFSFLPCRSSFLLQTFITKSNRTKKKTWKSMRQHTHHTHEHRNGNVYQPKSKRRNLWHTYKKVTQIQNKNQNDEDNVWRGAKTNSEPSPSDSSSRYDASSCASHLVWLATHLVAPRPL